MIETMVIIDIILDNINYTTCANSGDTAIVGALLEDTGTADAGSAYIFVTG